MTCTIETYTSHMAEEALATGVNCRAISAVTVLSYVRDQDAGRWEDGSQIVYDINGVLRDGQHRMAAQVQTGRTVTYSVIRGASEEFIKTLDQGRPRRAAAVLGETNQTVAIARIVAVAQQSTARRSSVGSIEQLLTQLGRQNLEAVQKAAPGGQLKTSVRAALVLVRPLNPRVVDALAGQLARRDGSSGPETEIGQVLRRPLSVAEAATLGALIAVANTPITTGDGKAATGRHGIFYRAIRGLLLFLAGKGVSQLRASPSAYEDLMKARKSRRLVVEFTL
jgi:hypothetical protein